MNKISPASKKDIDEFDKKYPMIKIQIQNQSISDKELTDIIKKWAKK